jgi:hypothetical protein
VPRIYTLALFALFVSNCFGQSVDSIIQSSVQANSKDWNAAPEYSCFERDRESDGGTKTFEDLMIFGSPYQRLVEVNGRRLSNSQQEQERQKLQQTIAERRNESTQDRAERIAKYQKDRKRDHLLIQQLTEAFNFKLMGEQKLDGHDVYVLKATPRAGYQPPNMDTQVLKGMEGRLWIDRQTSQWVRVEARVIHPVSIEGFLAQVQPGTEFELEKAPVDGDIWQPTHYAMRAHAKILFMFGHKSQDNETYYKYRKLTPEQALSEGSQ